MLAWYFAGSFGSPASGMFVPWLTVMPRPATKSSSSSWVMPLMTGTRANCPRASAAPIGWVQHRAVNNAGNLDAELR